MRCTDWFSGRQWAALARDSQFFFVWLMLSHALVAQINLNPPNQLLPPQIRTAPAAQAPLPPSQPDPNAQSTFGQPHAFRAAPAVYRTAQQPAAAQPMPPSGNTPAALASQTSPSIPQQVVTPVSDASAITQDAALNYIQQLQVATDLDGTLKQTLITAYEAVLAELKSRAESERVSKELSVLYEAAPAATVEAKKRKENPVPRKIFADGTLEFTLLETLQSYQLEIQGLAQAATDGRMRVEAGIVAREARRRDIPRLIAEDKSTITKLNEELALPVPDGIDPRVREANTLLLKSKLLAINERIRRLEQEQRTYDAELELLPARKDILLAEEKFQHAKLKEVKDELGKRREIQIADQKRKIEELLAYASPEIKSRAQSLLKRSDDWLQLAKHNSSIRMEVDSARSELKLWGERYKIMAAKISPKSSRHVTNFNSWVGLMLRKQRNELPDIGDLRKKLHDYQTRSLATETLILELDDWKASSTLAEEFSSEPAITGNHSVEQFATAPVADQKRILLASERKLVDEFRVDASNYFDNLIGLAETNQETIDQVYVYRSFIDENVLWIRSSEPFNKGDFRQLWPSVKWLFDLQNWRPLPAILLSDVKTHGWAYLLGFVSYLGLLFNLKRIKFKIADLGKHADRTGCTSFLPTLKVVVLSALLSAPLAIVHLVLGWRLVVASDGNAFANAIGVGLLVSARYFFPLEFIRQICRSGGLAEKHFDWPSGTTRHLRTNLRWFIDLAVPAVTIVGIIAQFGEVRWENSLCRLTFSLLMSLCFFYLLSLLHPKRGVFAEFLQRNAGGWIDRLRYVWYAGLSVGPLALMAMSIMGYHYTAIRLAMLLHTTFMTLIGLVFLSSLIRRWLLTRRRQIAVSQARQRLEEARRRDPGIAPVVANSTAPTATDVVSDLSEINDQTIRLVRSTLVFAAIAAVAFIWSGVLPAVGVLESIKLWTVEGAGSGERIPITLAHMLVAIPTIIMTVVAARNLPGLLEIALLQHLPIENAVRYAIASLSRYAILILGIAMTFNSIGVRWASIQWLVAALGVGLGFGLQEIFANFVSGLILLFEQPIRVGDVITLGDTTGVVSRIRMRATTVTNFDQQELIIPNKDLITGRLLNWTLSDTTNRITISVGVSYASDPEAACGLLKDVCSSHPNVLSSPEPTAFFERFGDSTLDLTARVFLANLDQRLPTQHDLHSQILKKFGEAGIEISFPQRDLHLRTVPQDLLSVFGRSEKVKTEELGTRLAKSA
ncbi:MAG: mechanosensitive ion channel domain-containing protein [Pirellula sp.]